MASTLKFAVLARQRFVWSAGAVVTDTLVFTVNVALLVTEPRKPVTSTVYVPASTAVAAATVRLLELLPCATPSLRQMKLNGPLPPATVLNVAASPGQTTKLVSADAVVVTGETTTVTTPVANRLPSVMT